MQMSKQYMFLFVCIVKLTEKKATEFLQFKNILEVVGQL